MVNNIDPYFIKAEQTTILLIRHGETDWNLASRIQGQTNIPLNQTGVSQAESVATILARDHSDISAVYSSDLDRAATTAQATADKLKLTVTKQVSFREMNYGAAEGLTVQEKDALYKRQELHLDAIYPDRIERWQQTAIPEAETSYEVAERVKGMLTQISALHSGKKLVVFTHGRTIRTIIEDSLNISNPSIFIGNCCIAEFVYSPEASGNPFRFIQVINPL
jgi:broad specificity phosphatase PhoE